MKVYIAKIIDKYDDSTLALLDRQRRGKVSAIRNEKEKLRSISAGLILRHAFIDMGKSNEEWENVTINSGEYGKPYIEGYEAFNYSLSHSGEYVMCATDSSEIGADIQEMRKWKVAMARRFFHQSEYERIIGREDVIDQTREFYKMWAAKESAVKLNGRGIGAGIRHLVTDNSYKTIKDINDDKSFHIKVYDEVGGYIICVCSREDKFPDRLRIISL